MPDFPFSPCPPPTASLFCTTITPIPDSSSLFKTSQPLLFPRNHSKAIVSEGAGKRTSKPRVAMVGKALSLPPPSGGSPIGAGDPEPGFSGGSPSPIPPCNGRGARQAAPPPRPARFFFDDLSDDESHHFLDFCFLCKKHLGGNRDIYMYRGDTPFCSVECRQEEIERDEARERNWKLAVMEQHKHKKSASPTKSQRIKVRQGTVVPA